MVPAASCGGRRVEVREVVTTATGASHRSTVKIVSRVNASTSDASLSELDNWSEGLYSELEELPEGTSSEEPEL